MMLRYKGLFHVKVILAITVLYLATPSKAGDICIWCNPAMSEGFLNCVCEKIISSPFFQQLPRSSLDDMKNSMLAAANAITYSDNSIKMNMMNGAMAGQIAELIKSQSAFQNPDEVTADLMGITGTCYTELCGQPDINFVLILGRMVATLLTNNNAPSDDKSAELSYSAPPQNQVQSYANSAAFTGKDPNYQLRYLNAPQPQTAFVGNNPSIFTPTRGNSKTFWNTPYKKKNTGDQSYLAQPIISQGNANAVSSTYSNIPYGTAPVGQKPVSESGVSSSSQQNSWSLYAPNAANEKNSNPESTNTYSYTKQNNPTNSAPSPDFPQNYGSWNTAVFNYPINGQNTQPKVPEQNTQQTSSVAFSEAKTFQPNQNFVLYPQNQFQNLNTNGEALGQGRSYPQNNLPYNSPNQFGQSDADANALSFNEPQLSYDYVSNYPTSSVSASSSSSSTSTNDNGINAVVASSRTASSRSSSVLKNNPSNANAQGNGYPSDNTALNSWRKASSNKGKNLKPNSDGKLHTEVKFYEALYYDLYTPKYFKYTFNKKSPKFYAKSRVEDMLDNLYGDYGDVALKTEKECVKRMSLLPANCETEIYAKVIAKCVSDVFSYYNLILPDTPATQARDIAIKMNNFLKQINKKKWQATTDSSPPQNTGNIQDVPQNTEDYPNYPKAPSNKVPPSTATSLSSSNFNPNNAPGSSDDDYYYYYYYIDYPQTDQTQKQQLNTANTPKDKSKQPDSAINNYYDYYYEDYPTSQTDQVSKQQRQQINTVNTTKDKSKPPDSSVNKYYYHQYDDDYPIPQTQQRPKQQKQQNYYYQYPHNYPTLQTNKELEQKKQQTDLVSDDQQGYGTQKSGNSDGGQQSINQASTIASSSSDAKQSRPQNDKKTKERNGKVQNKTAKSQTNTNLNDVVETSQGNDYPVNSDKQTTFSKHDIPNAPTNIPNNYQNPDLTENVNPSQTTVHSQKTSNGKNTESRNRIKILMQQALSNISDGKFDYKLYSSFIAALAKSVQNAHPEWGSQKAQITVLVETITGLTQLLLQAQNCLADKGGNSGILETPYSAPSTSVTRSSDQTSAEQTGLNYSKIQQNNFNNDYQRGQANANSIVQENSALPLIPVSEYPAPIQNNVNIQQNTQDYPEVQQNWSSGYQAVQSNQNSIPPIQNNYADQQEPASWPSTPEQTNSNIRGQGTPVLNGQTNSFSTFETAVSSSGIPNSNLNQNIVPLNNQGNSGFSSQGLNNQNLMQTGYQGSIQTENLQQNVFPQNNNMFIQGSQQNWGSALQFGQGNGGLIP